MQYRAEIDGLRAVAVIPVILFHAGFTNFSGGFVGVDVFFVISGYLITTIILTEQQGNRFSLAKFYERRARRILPALFLVMATSFALSWYTLSPAYMAEFSRSLAAVAAFGSNVLFWKESGYFGTENELKPLLHTWSLAVEEQYYVLFPLLMMVLAPLRRRAVFFTLMMILSASLILSELGARENSNASFFLLHSRAWELALGALIALYFLYGKSETSKQRESWLTELLAGSGLLLIAFAVITFDRTTPFPGLAATIPTLGTALVIVFASGQNRVGKILGSPVPVGLGLISYSAYLWHQPLFAISRHHHGRENSHNEYFFLIALTLILAFLSWKFVEQPARDRSRFSRGLILVCALSGSLAFATIGIAGHLNKGFPGRYSEEELQFLEFLNYLPESSYRSRECFMDHMQGHDEFSQECIAGNELMIWGDSHAASLFYGFNAEMGSMTQLAASGCPPLLGYEPRIRPQCPALIRHVLEVVSDIKPEVLLLLANWDDPLEDYEVPLEDLLINTIKTVQKKSPQTRIVLLGGLPKWRPALPLILHRENIKLEDERHVKSVLIDDIAKYDKLLKEIAQQHQVEFISLIDIYCHDGMCLSSAQENGSYQPFAFDYGHMTEAASHKVAIDIIDWLGSKH